ncbi:MAG: T9SS type A sorting domain-containing protein [Bacteroidota bacterium]|nr:T9SS type A sorting domain-containing protein [Bacteroidota bacterium]
MKHLSAQRIIAGEIFYEQIDSFKYIVTAHLYRKCEGSSLGNINAFIYTDSLKINMNFQRVSIINISDTCGNPCNIQNNMSNPGIEKHTYVDTINLKSSSYKIILQKNICNIYFGINQPFREGNLNTLEDNWFYLDAMVNICHGGKFVKSPEFNIKPKSNIICNQPMTYNPGVVNFDNEDSLGFELRPIEYDKGKFISYTSNFSLEFPVTPYCPPNPGVINCRPLPNAKPPRGFYFDKDVCEITYTPTKCDEVSIIKFKINQYRYDNVNKKHELIGYVQREMVQKVYIDNNTEYPGYTVNSNKFNLCSDQEACIKINASNSNKDSVYLNWNNTIKEANVKLTDSNTLQKEISICTTPQSLNNRTRKYYFALIASNKQCNSFISKGFVINALPTIKSKLTTQVIIGCNALALELKPINQDSIIPNQNLEYKLQIKHLANQQTAFNSSKPTDTFKFEQNGKYVIESKLYYKPSNCGITNFDTIELIGIFPMIDGVKDSLVCKGDTIVLGDKLFDLSLAKVSWEFPIGNKVLDSSNVFAFIQNGNRNNIRMRYQNNQCNSFQDLTIYSDSNNFETNFKDTGICNDNTIPLKLVNVFPKAKILWIINNTDSTYVTNYGNLKIDNDKHIKIQLINNPKCIEEKNILIVSKALPMFHFTDSFSCQNTPKTIQPFYSNHSLSIQSYSWMINQMPLGNNNSELTYLFNNLQTKVQLKISDSIGCSYSQTMNFKTQPLPLISFIDSSSCRSLTPFITVIDSFNSPLNYFWTIDGDTLNHHSKTLYYDFKNQQLITLKAVDSFGCSSEKSMTTSLLSRPNFEIVAPKFCDGQTIQIKLNINNSNPIQSYEWYVNNIKTNDTSGTLSGKFSDTTFITHTLKDNNHCIASQSIQIAPYKVNVSIIGDTNYNYHEYVKLSANQDFKTYFWNNGIKAKNNEFWAKSLGPPRLYTITLKVKDSNACEGNHFLIINTNQFSNLQAITNTPLQIFPNPSNALFTIKTSISGQVEIYNIDGKLLLNTHIHEGEISLNLETFSEGIYFLKFEGKAYKLVLQR